jgi:hypothetical protein
MAEHKDGFDEKTGMWILNDVDNNEIDEDEEEEEVVEVVRPVIARVGKDLPVTPARIFLDSQAAPKVIMHRHSNFHRRRKVTIAKRRLFPLRLSIVD